MADNKIKIEVSFDTSKVSAGAQKVKDAIRDVQSTASSLTPGGRVGGGRTPKAPPYIVDPDGYIQANQEAAWAGDASASANVLRAIRQKRMIARAQEATRPPSKFEAWMRTRFGNIGGKMVAMPLGRDLGSMASQMGDNLGMSEAGSVASAIASVGSGGSPLAAGVIALTASTTALNKTMSSLARGGGGTGNAWGAMTAAAAVGSAGPGNLSSASGVKAALMASLGENPIRGYYGAIDDNETYLRLARKVSRMSYPAARRVSRGLEDPEMANYAMMDPWVSNIALRNREDSPWMSRLGANVQGLAPTIGEGLALGPVGVALKWLSSKQSASPIGQAIDTGIGTVFPAWTAAKLGIGAAFGTPSNPMEAFGQAAVLGPAGIAAKLGMKFLEGDKGGDQTAKEQIKATKELTNVMKDGIYGGGSRARSAIPLGRQNTPNGIGAANRFGMGFL